MTSIIITMVVIVTLALLAMAVVAVGMRGKFSEKAPTVADRLNVMGSHLNGEADIPPQLLKAYEHGEQRIREARSRRSPATAASAASATPAPATSEPTVVTSPAPTQPERAAQ